MAAKNNLIAQINSSDSNSSSTCSSSTTKKLEPLLDNRPLPVPDQPKENSLVQTFEPYEQPSTSTTHHSSRGRGGGRGRGGAHRSAINNENDEDQGWIKYKPIITTKEYKTEKKTKKTMRTKTRHE